MSLFEYNEEEHMACIREEGKEEGLEKGRKEGLEKGRKEGIEEGRKEGLEEGRKEGKIIAAADLIKRKMASSGMTFEEVCSDLLLDEEEISSCRAYLESHDI